MAIWRGILALLSVLPVVTAADSSCHDIDSQACVLMAAQRQDFCKDEVLAPTACSRFCHLCPLECYHCNTTVADFHMCNTTKQCGQGEVCMRKQLRSFMDGHEEYQLTCESKQTCDGLGLVIPFGKRNLESRDISISCCDTDGCNYPGKVTTTQRTTTRRTTTTNRMTTQSAGCKKDVIVIVDESNSLAPYPKTIGGFLSNVFSNLPIGQEAVLVSLATFASTTTKRWDLNDHTTGSSLQHALATLSLDGGSGDLNAAIDFAVKHVNTGFHGNRRDAPDVVIIISDDVARSHSKESSLESQLHAETDNVIAIGIGTHLTSSEILHLASDGHHDFRVPTPQYLNFMYHNVAQLICDRV